MRLTRLALLKLPVLSGNQLSFTANTRTPRPESVVGPLPTCTQGPVPTRAISPIAGAPGSTNPPVLVPGDFVGIHTEDRRRPGPVTDRARRGHGNAMPLLEDEAGVDPRDGQRSDGVDRSCGWPAALPCAASARTTTLPTRAKPLKVFMKPPLFQCVATWGCATSAALAYRKIRRRA